MKNSKLIEIRKTNDLSQSSAAAIIGIPLRTYIRYENNESYGDSLKRQMIEKVLQDRFEITEDKGLLTVESIKKGLKEVLAEYKDGVEFCYLYGSYAKGYAKENSDVDLCVSTSLTGLKYVGLAERIRSKLHKKIDLTRLSDLSDNVDLMTEILKSGIKVYG
ncbi:MAG: nucleotidyltransferase domain-containing protein [Dehalococcoidales bacterium]|nr:nucleotidyltransferase domain-containing protein [Dehalococcoidales bacterium]